jgi:DNA primase large subunit
MDEARLSEYPFLTKAAEYVAGMDSTLDEILVSRGYGMSRSRAKSRVIQAIKGEIKNEDTGLETTELLSYPIARILVSCIDDAFLIRRYALAEAKFAHSRMGKEDGNTLTEIGQDFNINASITEKGFKIHFTDYIRGAAGMRALNWKLVNRRLDSGYVNISKEQYARLLQEAIRVRIFEALPLDVPDMFCQTLADYIKEIKTCLEKIKKEFDEEGFGQVEPGYFPPCIIHLLSSAQAGVNLPHSARFALTSFLLNIGLSVDHVVQMFNVSPDFNEEMTHYQVDHIAGSTGTSYKPPSCTTMITYGNCYNKDEICRNIGHPLSYYRKKKKIQQENLSVNKKPESIIHESNKPEGNMHENNRPENSSAK